VGAVGASGAIVVLGGITALEIGFSERKGASLVTTILLRGIIFFIRIG